MLKTVCVDWNYFNLKLFAWQCHLRSQDQQDSLIIKKKHNRLKIYQFSQSRKLHSNCFDIGHRIQVCTQRIAFQPELLYLTTDS